MKADYHRYMAEVLQEKKDHSDKAFEAYNSALQEASSNLRPSSNASESKVFYYKMKADYHRYMAEVLQEKKDH